MQKVGMVLILLAVTSTSVFAEFGTPEEQAACYPDVRRLCPHLTSESLLASKLACVILNRHRFGKKCDAVLKKHGL